MQQQFIALPPFTKGSLRDLPKSAEVMYREQNVFISLTLVLKSTTDFDRTLSSYLLEEKSTLLSGISSSLQTRGGEVKERWGRKGRKGRKGSEGRKERKGRKGRKGSEGE